MKTRLYILSYTFLAGNAFCALGQVNVKALPVPLHPAPEVEFSYPGLCYGDSTRFINHTISCFEPRWTILTGDGDTIFTAADTNITFLFPDPGSYRVILSA